MFPSASDMVAKWKTPINLLLKIFMTIDPSRPNT